MSTFLDIRDMESKATLKIHLISIKVAMIEKTNDDKLEVLAKYRGRGILF